MAWPLLVIGTGALAAASWLLGSFGAGTGGIVFAALGGALVLVGLVAAVLLLSIRMEVHEAAVRLAWLGGERIYPLTRGPVTRVRLRGPEASRLKPRFGVFGWSVGSAQLRDEEEINVVRLARTRTAILVPTERGRLAISAADEDQLLDALSRAARARQRLEELADVARVAEPVPPAEPEPAPEPEPTIPAAAIEPEPRILTGIERALLEQRLADERAAAEATAAAEGATAGAIGVAAPSAAGLAVQPAVELKAEAEPGPPRRIGLRRPRPSAAFVLLPLGGAGAAWGIGLALGTYPPPGTDAGRLTALALVLAGPATSVGAVMALAWWPRIVGVVVSGGLAASVFVARALLG